MASLNETMAKLYVKLIKSGRKTLDEVPEELRELVEEMLNA